MCQQNSPFDSIKKNTATQSVKVVHSRLAGFGIPFKIDDQDGKFIEVQLYMSSNKGADWEFLARQSIDQSEFPFRARGEGEYWFALKTLDRNRQLLPAGEAQPELKIIVDTTRPELELFVETDRAGRIVCRWQAADRFLNTAATRLQYRPTLVSGPNAGAGNEPAWQDVTLNPPADLPSGIYSDQLAFWPDTETGKLELRMAVADKAGNFAVAYRVTNVSRPAWRHSTRATARPTDRQAVDPGNVPSPTADVRSITCKDGVCEVQGASSNPNDADVWKQAFYSKLRRQENQHYRDLKSHEANAKANSKASPPNREAYQPPRVGNAHGAPPRSASRRNGVAAMLVGSEPEFAAPPVPEGWVVASPSDGQRPVQPQPLETFSQPPSPEKFPQGKFPQPDFPQRNFPDFPQRSSPQRSSPQRSSQQPYRQPASKPSIDVWESAVHRNENDTRESVGSTNQPDRSMLPLPSLTQSQRRTAGPADAVAANPSTFRRNGDQVVGSSTTQWPQNQYQGLASNSSAAAPQTEMVPAVPNAIFRSPAQPVQPPSGFQSVSAPMNGSTAPRRVENKFTTKPTRLGSPSGNGPSKSNTQVIGTKRFRLSYDIDAIDPSGVGKVDLWMTVDQGRTWQLWGSDPDNTSPFPVEVQREGLFGFRVVIHSREGLAGVGPSSGDDADMWVRVDTQAPMAQITSVPYGRGKEAGRLVIHYRVADPFLTLRPVRLSYSRSPQGPWTIIEDDLRNEGRYVWKVSAAVPDRIFLKIDALDSAGNVGSYLLPQAIDVSGLVPRGTIHAVQPVGR